MTFFTCNTNIYNFFNTTHATIYLLIAIDTMKQKQTSPLVVLSIINQFNCDYSVFRISSTKWLIYINLQNPLYVLRPRHLNATIDGGQYFSPAIATWYGTPIGAGSGKRERTLFKLFFFS